MTDLPIADIPLAEIEHVTVSVHGAKLGPVLRGLREGAELPPIWLSRDHGGSPWRLEDGNHRLHAARMLGDATIRAITATGPEQIRLAEQLWSIGAIGVAEADARSAVRRHREAIARCGLEHLFPNLPLPQEN